MSSQDGVLLFVIDCKGARADSRSGKYSTICSVVAKIKLFLLSCTVLKCYEYKWLSGHIFVLPKLSTAIWWYQPEQHRYLGRQVYSYWKRLRLPQLWSLNLCSIVSKKRDLQALLTSEKVDVDTITETFLSADTLDSELVDEISFTVFRWDCIIGMEGSCWSFEVKSLQITLRLIANFMGRDHHSFIQYPFMYLLSSTWHGFRPT